MIFKRTLSEHILLTTIAAVVLVGCKKPDPPRISIHLAAGQNDGTQANINVIKKHLAAETDVNEKDISDGGKTPLMHAVFWGHKEIAKLLVSNGADIDLTDADAGASSLHYSVLGHYWEPTEDRYSIVKFLLESGAAVNVISRSSLVTRSGGTTLDMANESKQIEIADLLRKHGGKTSEELKAEGK